MSRTIIIEYLADPSVNEAFIYSLWHLLDVEAQLHSRQYHGGLPPLPVSRVEVWPEWERIDSTVKGIHCVGAVPKVAIKVVRSFPGSAGCCGKANCVNWWLYFEDAFLACSSTIAIKRQWKPKPLKPATFWGSIHLRLNNLISK